MKTVTTARTSLLTGMLCLIGVAVIHAHATWLSPVPDTARIGESASVVLLNGHTFPKGEEPLKGLDLSVTVLDPAGHPSPAPVADRSAGPTIDLRVTRSGVYRVYAEMNRGVISRTTEGWKPGGRSLHPASTLSVRSYSSFVCAVRTPDAAIVNAQPRGLPFEVSWTRQASRLSILATAGGKPVEGAQLAVIVGAGEAKVLGTTGATGRLDTGIPAGFAGPILLTGSLNRPVPKGADYQEDRWSSSHYLVWR